MAACSGPFGAFLLIGSEFVDVDLTREDEFVDLTIGEVAGTHGSGGADAKHDARAGGKPGAKPSLKRKATGDPPTARARAPAGAAAAAL